MKKKRIFIAGSTGSIGTQTLEVVDQNEDMEVFALAAGKNIDLLECQARKYHPQVVCLWEEEKARELSHRLEQKIPVLWGMEGLQTIAEAEEYDVFLGAMMGMIGILPTLRAVSQGKDIALANKETLVCAGHLIEEEKRKSGSRIFPVDSEHSAIFQCLEAGGENQPEALILTASGGPFYRKTKEELQQVTKEDALRHPTWTMGSKITIDSSTLVNKGLEVMEASWLFHMPVEQIKVFIHPQSIIHSMVQWKDGAVLAQLGVPDMKLPIQYALTWPQRREMTGNRLQPEQWRTLTLEEPDLERFPGLKLGIEAGKIGGSMPTVYNAANECAVELFLKDKISWSQIPYDIQRAMDAHPVISHPSLEEILSLEQEIRHFVKGI